MAADGSILDSLPFNHTQRYSVKSSFIQTPRLRKPPAFPQVFFVVKERIDGMLNHSKKIMYICGLKKDGGNCINRVVIHCVRNKVVLK